MGWTWIDWSLAGIIALSTIISLVRGFTREVLSLITWAVAIWVAIKFTVPAAEFLKEDITSPELRLVTAFVGLFITTLIAGSLVNYIISRLVITTGLSGTDRLLGSLFGITRGVLIGVLLIIAAGFTPIIHQPAWKNTQLIPIFTPLTQWLLSYIPKDGTMAWISAQVMSKQQMPEQTTATNANRTTTEKKSTVQTHAETPVKKPAKKVFPDRPILEAKD